MFAAILYETVIPPDERRQLGEYYTPDWLARAIVREVVTDPLDQYVLDPSCGSGTFVAEAVNHFIEAANETSLDPKEVLEWLRFSVAGIDVHPGCGAPGQGRMGAGGAACDTGGGRGRLRSQCHRSRLPRRRPPTSISHR